MGAAVQSCFRLSNQAVAWMLVFFHSFEHQQSPQALSERNPTGSAVSEDQHKTSRKQPKLLWTPETGIIRNAAPNLTSAKLPTNVALAVKSQVDSNFQMSYRKITRPSQTEVRPHGTINHVPTKPLRPSRHEDIVRATCR